MRLGYTAAWCYNHVGRRRQAALLGQELADQHLRKVRARLGVQNFEGATGKGRQPFLCYLGSGFDANRVRSSAWIAQGLVLVHTSIHTELVRF